MVFYFYMFLFACPKRNTKRAPDRAGPSGSLALLAVAGTLKTHRLRRFRQVQRLFPATTAMLSGTNGFINRYFCFRIFQKI